MNGEERARLAKLLSQRSRWLSVAELRVAVLAINFGKDVKTIAGLLGVKVGTVRGHLQRAKRKMEKAT